MFKKERVQGCEEYQVDTSGTVYSKYGRPLKPSVNPRGYAVVNMMINGKRVGATVHSLVAKQFLGCHDPIKTQVNHIDGNKLNNNVNNLEWVTPLENVGHSRTMLGFDNSGANNGNAKVVRCYDILTGKLYMEFGSVADAAKCIAPNSNYRRIQNAICRAINHGSGEYRNYMWRYADVMEWHTNDT